LKHQKPRFRHHATIHVYLSAPIKTTDIDIACPSQYFPYVCIWLALPLK